MPAADTRVTTIEQLLALPEDGLRHELLDGVHVVSPAPSLPHQRVLRELFLALRGVLGDRKDLEVLWSPADIVLGPKTLVQPDLFVIRKPPGAEPRSWSEVGTPFLVVEILSPTTASRDRGPKRRIYQRAGVQEYWIVDLDARLIERWQPDDDRPEICEATLRWTPPDGAPVELDVAFLFETAGT
jgi:Uma2 family endonuclease